MYSYLIPLFKGFTTSISLITAIGPQNSFVLKQAILRSHIFLIASLCSVIDSLLIILGVNGAHALMNFFPNLINLIRYAGIIFLLLYGLRLFVGVFRSADVQLATAPIKNQQRKKIILTILAVSFLNPHTYLDSMVLIGSVGAHFVGLERTMFTIGAIIASIIWFFSIAYFGRFLRPIFDNACGRKIFDLIIALMMWGIAISLIWQ